MNDFFKHILNSWNLPPHIFNALSCEYYIEQKLSLLKIHSEVFRGISAAHL